MATITGLTAERMLGIEAASVVDGEVVGGNLLLTKFDGTQINAGSVIGPPGPQGPVSIGSIPGEIRMWSGTVLPAQGTYGKWVWADGAVFAVANYPIAAANIATQWRTAHGATDPGAGSFRVPDLRGLVPAALDLMPGGVRANRMTRAAAITIATKTGEETHVITIDEMPSHAHTFTGSPAVGNQAPGDGPDTQSATFNAVPGPTIDNTGGGTAHENVQPTIFIPYIVSLSG